MKRVLSFAILGVLVVLMACAKMQGANDVPRVTKEELKARLGSTDVVLLDVRAKTDWETSDEKVAGAKRMDPETVDNWAGTLPKDKDIILYCA